jgi:hypothetical protein
MHASSRYTAVCVLVYPPATGTALDRVPAAGRLHCKHAVVRVRNGSGWHRLTSAAPPALSAAPAAAALR